MITVKQAVAAAEAYVPQLYESVTGILLEEVELIPEKSQWSVTLSFFTRKAGITTTSPMNELLRMNSSLAGFARDPNDLRLYRRFLVDASSGAVMAMKAREKDA